MWSNVRIRAGLFQSIPRSGNCINLSDWSQSISDVAQLGKTRVPGFPSDNPRFSAGDRTPNDRLVLLLANPPDVEHLRLELEFDGSGPYKSLWFWDRRGLGVVRLIEPGQLHVHCGPEKLGPDALEMTASDWADRCGKTGREIKGRFARSKDRGGDRESLCQRDSASGEHQSVHASKFFECKNNSSTCRGRS